MNILLIRVSSVNIISKCNFKYRDKILISLSLGWNEAKMLAHRYRKHFPNIFQDYYDESKFLFRYTDVHRTEASFKAFTEGKFFLIDHIAELHDI